MTTETADPLVTLQRQLAARDERIRVLLREVASLLEWEGHRTEGYCDTCDRKRCYVFPEWDRRHAALAEPR